MRSGYALPPGAPEVLGGWQLGQGKSSSLVCSWQGSPTRDLSACLVGETGAPGRARPLCLDLGTLHWPLIWSLVSTARWGWGWGFHHHPAVGLPHAQCADESSK